MLSPKRIVAFDLVDGVWVTEVRCALPVALALRQSLIELSSIRYAGEGQQTKMELVTALGIIARIVFSQPVVVDVETPVPLTDLNVTPPRLDFSHVGEHANFTVMGKLADGTVLNIRHSSNMSYQTQDAKVATVSADGVVTATGVGTTGILVKYGGHVVPVPVSVAN